jgi:hypothetical protein
MTKRSLCGIVLLVCSVLIALPAQAQPDPDLIQPDDLVYRGAFRLPDDPPDAWAYSGAALAYYPAGDADGPADGTPGSLFATGHDWYQAIAELSIPAPVIAANVADLPVAETIQPLRDFRANLFGELEIARAGLAYLPETDRLYFAWAQHMGEGDTNATHGAINVTLDAPDLIGPWRVGDFVNYVTGDYLFPIPADWAAQHTPGLALATGRFRDGGQGSQGPTLIAVRVADPPDAGEALPTLPLLLYGTAYDEASPHIDDYCEADEWTGGAWLTADDRAAIVFAGTHGLGDCWYGCSDGTVWEEPYPDDCSDHNRGWWSTAFGAQLMFFNPDDLAAVAAGEMEPWIPQPYAVLDLEPVLFNLDDPQRLARVGAIAFDSGSGLLYVMQPFGDGDKPVVHVWAVDSAG